MSQLATAVLEGLEPEQIFAARRRNYQILAAALEKVAFFSQWPAEAVPLAFPIKVPQADAVAAALHAQGIFAQRHWAQLPSPASLFPEAHRLAQQLISLPCDHRYGPAHMEQVIQAVQKLL